jgi:antirestriction protein ArdC
MPFNPTTEKLYRAGNAIHLMTVGVTHGYGDPRWMTYRQARENGWYVREGEKGTHIEYWEFPKQREATEDDMKAALRANNAEQSGNAKDSPRLVHRVYTVFNAKQIQGIPTPTSKRIQEFEIVEAGESILKNSGAKIQHDQNDRAFYDRHNDRIHLLEKEAFNTAANYYDSALHELAHWSGHSSRLSRQTLNESRSFDDEMYAREELRAELASIFLAAERGVPHDPANHAAYVASWIKTLRNDKNEIFRAATDAHRAADFLLALEREQSVRRDYGVRVS